MQLIHAQKQPFEGAGTMRASMALPMDTARSVLNRSGLGQLPFANRVQSLEYCRLLFADVLYRVKASRLPGALP